MHTKLGIIVVLGFVSLLCGEAKAHDLLDDAIASYEDADFRSALRTFNLAARDADLSSEELLLLFEMRALVHHAMGNQAAMLRDLERVGAVDPSHQLGELAPPPVRKAFEEMLEARGGTLGVELVIEEKALDAKPFIVARIENVPKDLVHHIGLQCRVPPDGRIMAQTAQGYRARMKLAESGGYETCTATAETRRGTVLFRASLDGTRPAALPPPAPQPEVPTPLPSVFQTPEYEAPIDQPTAKKKKKWPWLVAAAAVVVAGGVTAGVILSKNSSQGPPAPGGVTVNW